MWVECARPEPVGPKRGLFDAVIERAEGDRGAPAFAVVLDLQPRPDALHAHATSPFVGFLERYAAVIDEGDRIALRDHECVNLAGMNLLRALDGHFTDDVQLAVLASRDFDAADRLVPG